MKIKTLTALALLFSASAFAQDAAAPASAKGDQPCKADVAAFCKDAKPGHGGIAKCLKAHKDELSEACKAKVISRAKKARTEKREKRTDEGGQE